MLGGGGDTDGKGHIVAQSIQVGEKIYQDYKLVATNPGGHSSQPVRENAIYSMSDALLKVGAHEFPAEFNDTTRAFFAVGGTMFTIGTIAYAYMHPLPAAPDAQNGGAP